MFWIMEWVREQRTKLGLVYVGSTVGVGWFVANNEAHFSHLLC